MRVAVIGANGQLGTDLIRVLKGANRFEPIPLTRPYFDVRNASQVLEVLIDLKPDVVINTAAFTRVDDCEDQPALAFEVNTLGTRNVAIACAELKCVLVHLSTDYVFDGKKREPYTEEDLPNPINVYGVSKLAGEHFVRSISQKYYIIRTSGLYGVAGSSGKGGNFVETMIRLAKEGKPIRVVNDQVLSPTYTLDLAYKVVELMPTEAYGLYHITNSGQCSWYEFAGKIFKLLGLEPNFGPIVTKEFGARARRPAYSVLSNEKLINIGLGFLRSWPEALKAYLEEKGRIRR